MVNGFNGTQAYLKVYGDVTDETAKVNASKLLTNTNVQSYLEEQKKELRKLNIMSKADKLIYLEDILGNKHDEQTRDRLKALEIHNKMTGDNEPDKSEITLDGGVSVNYNKPKK
jgi:phage terminase small subunit